MHDAREGNGFRAVVNQARQTSIWRRGKNLPDGWYWAGPPMGRDQALDVAADAYAEPDHGSEPAGTDLTIGGLVAEQVLARPEAVAVIDGDRRVTYRQLWTRVQELRSRLTDLGVRPDAAVGVCMQRGVDLLAALLAVMDSGAAYVPFDGKYPSARSEFMASDAGVTCVIVDPANGPQLATIGVPLLEVDGSPEGRDTAAVSPEPGGRATSLAYLMYTSGTSGKPKAVQVSQANLVAFLQAMRQFLPTNAADRVLFATRIAFDISALEMFFPLVYGGTCVIAPETRFVNVVALAKLIAEHRPTLLQATPASWRLLLNAGVQVSESQTALCGGDALGSELAERLSRLPGRAFNIYGPTEATVWATAYRIRDAQVDLGRALGHARVYVLDEDLAPVGLGEEGEIYLGGPAVARGYRGLARLTCAKFLPDPFAATPGARMFATGDLVRTTAAGMDFLGRKDSQVKIHGNRVELREIEAVACEVPGVREARAALSSLQQNRLLLYVLGSLDASETPLVMQRLRDRLPPAYVPAEVHVVQGELPLNDNGKVDLARLEQARPPS